MTKNAVTRRGFESLFVVGRAFAQIIPSMVNTVIEFDTQVYDLLEEMLIVNPYTFTPHKTGYYFLSARVRFNAMGLGNTLYLYLRLNGALTMPYQMKHCTMANQNVSLIVTAIQYLTPADAVDVVIFHNFGANRNIQGNMWETQFLGYRVK